MAGASKMAASRHEGARVVPLDQTEALAVARHQGDIKVVISEEELKELMKGCKEWDTNRSSLDKAEIRKNEQFIRLAHFVKTKRGANDLSLRPSQQLVMTALETGVVRHEREKENRVFEDRDLGPLAVTQPGLQVPLAPGEGKTLLSTLLAYQYVLSDMPVRLQWISSQHKPTTLAHFLREILRGGKSIKSGDPTNKAIVKQIVKQIADDNAHVAGYTLNGTTDRLMESTVFFGYNLQPAQTFIGDLPDLTLLLENEEKIDKIWRILRNLIKERTELLNLTKLRFDIDSIDKKRDFIRDTLLSGAVMVKNEDEVKLVKLGAELFDRVFGRQFMIGKYAEAMLETVIVGNHLYTPLSWLLARTVRFFGGKKSWRPIFPMYTTENHNCDTHWDVKHVVLLVGSWGTLSGKDSKSDKSSRRKASKRKRKQQIPMWLSAAHWGKLVRDEADIASRKDGATSLELKQVVEPRIPVSFHLSGTCDVLSSKERVARNVLGADYRFGYGLGQSVSIESPPSSLPSIFLYDGQGPNGKSAKMSSDVQDFISGFSVFAQKVLEGANLLHQQPQSRAQSAQERAFFETMVNYLPFAGTVSFSNARAVEKFQEEFQEIADPEYVLEEDASARKQEWYHCCNPNGDGLYSGYIKAGLDGEKWISLRPEARPKFKQFLTPIVDLEKMHKRWCSKRQAFIDIEADDVEKDFKSGRANLLIVLMKNIRGFNFPLQQFVMVLRSKGVEMNSFLQVLGRVTRNYRDSATIKTILHRHRKRLQGTVDEAVQTIEQKYLCGTGIPKRHLAKFLIIRNDNPHKVLAAKALFQSGISLQDIQALMQVPAFVTCSDCKKPLRIKDDCFSSQRSSARICELPDFCADITLPTYGHGFQRANELIDIDAFTDLGGLEADNVSESWVSPSQQARGPEIDPARHVRRRLDTSPPNLTPASTGRPTREEPDRDDLEPDATPRSMDGSRAIEDLDEAQRNEASERPGFNRARIDSAVNYADTEADEDDDDGDAGDNYVDDGDMEEEDDEHRGSEGGNAFINESAQHAENENMNGDAGRHSREMNDRESTVRRSRHGSSSDLEAQNSDSDDEMKDANRDEDLQADDSESGSDSDSDSDSESESDSGSESNSGADFEDASSGESDSEETHLPAGTVGKSDRTLRSSNRNKRKTQGIQAPSTSPIQPGRNVTRIAHQLDKAYEDNARKKWPSCATCKKPGLFTGDRHDSMTPVCLANKLHRMTESCFRGEFALDDQKRRCGIWPHEKHVPHGANRLISFAKDPNQRSLKFPKLTCSLCVSEPSSAADFDHFIENSSHDRVVEKLASGEHCTECLQPMILWRFSDKMSPISFVDYYAGFAPVASSTTTGKDPNEHLRKGRDAQGDYIFSVVPGVMGPGSRCTGCQRIVDEAPTETTVDVLSSRGTGTIESLRHRREHEPGSDYRRLIRAQKKRKSRCRKGGCMKSCPESRSHLCAEHRSECFWCGPCRRALPLAQRCDSIGRVIVIQEHNLDDHDDVCKDCAGKIRLSDSERKLLGKVNAELRVADLTDTGLIVRKSFRKAINERKLDRQSSSDWTFSLRRGPSTFPYLVTLHRHGTHTQSATGNVILKVETEGREAQNEAYTIVKRVCEKLQLPLRDPSHSASSSQS